MQRRSTNLLPLGLTLLELTIVLVILVVVAALAVPAIQRSFSAQRVSKAGELVRSELNRARIAAMRSGEIHGFFYFPESANYKIAPFNQEVVNVLKDSRTREDLRSSNFDYGDDQLPRGVVFSAGETTSSSRSEDTFERNDRSVRSLRPVLFYPDGSCQDARLLLKNEDNDLVEVKLRGMTGTSKMRLIDNERPSRR